jgi:hypothetical protein
MNARIQILQIIRAPRFSAPVARAIGTELDRLAVTVDRLTVEAVVEIARVGSGARESKG